MSSIAASPVAGPDARVHRGADPSTLVLSPVEGRALRAGTCVGPARLFNRNFLLLCQAQLVSQFGNQAFMIAMMAWTIETTQSATMSGLMVMAGVLPIVVLGPLTGTFADSRRSKLAIVVACDLAAGVLVLLLAAGFVVGPSAWRPAMLFTIALLVGVCNAFFDPAVNAFVPDLVRREQLEAANAFRQSSRQVTILTAQGLGGILYAAVGPAVLFLIDGASFLFAATESLIPNPQSIRNHQSIPNPQSIRNPQSTIRNVAAPRSSPRSRHSRLRSPSSARSDRAKLRLRSSSSPARSAA